jgi:curved DNA-binding protein CbpA
VNPYEVLGVERTASDTEIRRAYVALARRFHPDTNPGGEERMRAVNEAWAVLGDRVRRAEFDRDQRQREPDPDPGFRPHDPVDDGIDPRTQPDVPYRPVPRAARTRRELLTFLPVGLFASAAVVGGAGFFFDAPVLIGAGVALFSSACIAMIVVLLTTLVDARHDEG